MHWSFFRLGFLAPIAIGAAAFASPSLAQSNIETQVERFVPETPTIISPAKTRYQRVRVGSRVEETISPLGVRKREVVTVFDNVPIGKEERPLELKLISTTSYQLSSNATSAGSNAQFDGIFTQNLTSRLIVPVGLDEDTLTIFATSVVNRFAKLHNSNFDTFVGGIRYAIVVKKHPAAAPSQKVESIIRDVVFFGLETRSNFRPTFEYERVSFYFPTIGFERQEIPVGSSVCGTSGEEKYCYTANLTFKLQHYFFDVVGPNNTTAGVGVVFNAPYLLKSHLATMKADLNYKHYVDVPQGREDLVLDLRFGLERSLGKFSLAGEVSLQRLESSVPALSYSNFSFTPMIRLGLDAKKFEGERWVWNK